MTTASKDKMMIEIKIGELVQFTYAPLNTVDTYVGRLMEIRDCEKEPIQFASRWYGGHRTTRSQYLITLSTPNGYRKFYTGSIHGAKRVGLFARFALWLSGKNFEKFAAV